MNEYTKIIVIDEEASPESFLRSLRTPITLLAYSYSSGSYEGSGWAILFSNTPEKGVNVAFHNMSHCSCYGPWDNFVHEFSPCPTPEALEIVARSKMSAEAYKELTPVLAAVKLVAVFVDTNPRASTYTVTFIGGDVLTVEAIQPDYAMIIAQSQRISLGKHIDISKVEDASGKIHFEL